MLGVLSLTDNEDHKCEQCGNILTNESYDYPIKWTSEDGDTKTEIRIRIVCRNCDFDNYIRSEWV